MSIQEASHKKGVGISLKNSPTNKWKAQQKAIKVLYSTSESLRVFLGSAPSKGQRRILLEETFMRWKTLLAR